MFSLYLALLATVANAFQNPVLSPSSHRLSAKKLNDVDEMCIENVAELCLKADMMALSEECDLDEQEALVNQLEDQKTIMEAQANRIDHLLQRLKGQSVNGLLKEEEETYFAG